MRLRALVLTMLLAVAACGDSAGEAPGSTAGEAPGSTAGDPPGTRAAEAPGTSATAPEPIVFDEPLPFDPGPDVGGLTLQQELLADGEVTFDEYERAFTAGVECMRDEGFEVDGPLRFPDGGIGVEPGVDPRHQLSLLAYGITSEEDQRWSDVNQRCQVQWYYMVERTYLEQFIPTEEETRAWLERAWDCAAASGMQLTDPPTLEEAVLSVGFGCRPWETTG